MSDPRSLLERESRRFIQQEGAFERLAERRDRKRRNQRIRAGVLGLAIAFAVGWLGINAIRSTPPVPADDPTPTPASVGALAYALDGDIFVADRMRRTRSRSPTPPTHGARGSARRRTCRGRPTGGTRVPARCPSSDQDDMVITDPHGNVVGSARPSGWGFTWSPDSTRIAVWEPALTIGVYGIDGEREASFPPTVITGQATPAALGGCPTARRSLFGYAVVPLDGSAGYKLKLGGLDPSLGGQATYSPDGTRVAAVTGNSITVLDAEGSLYGGGRASGRRGGLVAGWERSRRYPTAS